MTQATVTLPVQAVARRRSLGLRFMLMVLVSAVLFALLAGLLTWRLAYQRVEQQSHDTLQSLAMAVEKTLAAGLFARDQVLMGEVVDGLARNALVAAVSVHGADGKVLVDRAQPGLSAARTAHTLVRPLNSPFDPTEQLGVLHLTPDDDSIDEAARGQALRQAGLMALQAALVAVALYVIGSRIVSHPIIRLAHQLRELEPGTAQRLPTPPANQQDEIGQLIHSANALLNANALALERERRLRAEVEALQAQYRRIFDSSSAGIFVLDAQGQLINGNPTVSNVVGKSLDDLRGLSRGSFLTQVFAEPAQVKEMIRTSLLTGETASADLELRVDGATTRWVHCLISVQGPHGQEELTVSDATVEGVIYDITERKCKEIAVRYQAEHDALTGLSNRAASTVLLDRFIDEALHDGTEMTVMCIDLDGFKQVNDQFGHHAGDQVLVACAHAMQGVVRRSSDLVGRLGGDEFIVALRGVGADHPTVTAVAAALLEHICRPVPLDDGREARVGASIGIAVCPRHGRTQLGLTHLADEALYRVKATGKNAFAMALPSS